MEGIKDVFGIGSTAGGSSQVNPLPVTEQVTAPDGDDNTNPDGGDVDPNPAP